MAVLQRGQGKSGRHIPPQPAPKARAKSTKVLALTGARTVWQAVRVGEPRSRNAKSKRAVSPRASEPKRPGLALVIACCMQACTPTSFDTVDLGDNPETADLSLDENFFHCEIQPKVITAQGCASGAAGEGGSCHTARSALRLVEVPTPSMCQNGKLVGSAAPESELNLMRVRSDVGVDADASPLYRRPLGLDSHPRQIFTSDSEPAMLLRMWLNGQGTP
jgi:hypothetical protein